MATEIARLTFGAIVCFAAGMNAIMQAKRLRRSVEDGFEKHGWFFRAMLFGDWILRYPRAHVIWIRLGGLLFVLIGIALAVLAYLGTRGIGIGAP